MLEDRADILSYTEPPEPVQRMIIFAHDMRTSKDGVAYRATMLTGMFDDDDTASVFTMNKVQKSKLNESIDELNKLDNALSACLGMDTGPDQNKDSHSRA